MNKSRAAPASGGDRSPVRWGPGRSRMALPRARGADPPADLSSPLGRDGGPLFCGTPGPANTPRALPDSATLHLLLELEPNGILRWRPRPQHMFTCAAHARWWNNAFAGAPAGGTRQTRPGGPPLRWVAIDGVMFPAARVIWAMARGKLSANARVLHRDGDYANCAPDNLYLVYITPRTASGHPGVRWRAESRRWNAYVHRAGGRKNLGLFTSVEAAVEARNAYLQELREQLEDVEQDCGPRRTDN